MGSHYPFTHLKHKLWPKERSGVKFAIWLLTTKSQESTRFPCVQVTCDILLESFQRGLQLCFRPHCNQRSAHQVMCLQSHLDVTHVERCKVYYKGEGGGFPQIQVVMSLVCPSCSWLVLALKVLQLCSNRPVLVLCKSMWILKFINSS
jgi:hypothetical protein